MDQQNYAREMYVFGLKKQVPAMPKDVNHLFKFRLEASAMECAKGDTSMEA
jgi:hypothetical protein